MTKFIASVGLLLAATFSATAQQAQVLTAAEIAGTFVGKTVKQVDDQYWAFFEPTGGLGGLYVNDEDRGRWGLNQNQICQQWSKWNNGQWSCFYILRGVGGAYRFDDGQGGGFNVTVKPGNPMDLL